MKQRILIVSILRADLTISGLALRYMALWKYLREHRPDVEVFLLTNNSLKEASFGPDYQDSRVFSFEDRGPGYVLKRILLTFQVVWLMLRFRVTSVHLAAGGGDYLRILGPQFRLLRRKVCLTYASASLDVTTADAPRQRQALVDQLKQARNLDVLNPTHQLPDYGYKKFVCPCSFPWTLAGGQFPDDPEQPERVDLVVFSGSFAAWKNPLLAIQGFAEFLRRWSQEFPHSQLVLIGKGPLQEQVTALTQEINNQVGRTAILLGTAGSSLDYLRRSKIFLSLQVPENYPSQSLMEAMLLCNTIVATSVGDTSLMVKPELGNYLVDTETASVAQALYAAFKNYQINRANRELILREHCVERFADYFLDMHRNLVA